MEITKNISALGPRFSKTFTTSLVCLIAAVLAWGGGDPWKSKPYQQWDANDVKKVLKRPRRSKVVQINASWKPTDTSGASGAGLCWNRRAGGGMKQGSSAAYKSIRYSVESAQSSGSELNGRRSQFRGSLDIVSDNSGGRISQFCDRRTSEGRRG